MDIERRFTPGHAAKTKVTSSRASSDGPVIRGHAAVFYDGTPDTEYEYGDIRERIMPTAFDRALKEKDDVRALFNHNADHLLGRVSAGSLKLSTDFRGLNFVVQPDSERELAKSVLSWVKRGELQGASFAFAIRKNGERWFTEGKQQIREILDVELFDVGPVTYPAYESTDVSVGQASKSSAAGLPSLGDPYPTTCGTNGGVLVAAPQLEWVNEKKFKGRSVAELRRELARRKMAARREKLDELQLPIVEGYAAKWGEEFEWDRNRTAKFMRNAFREALKNDSPAVLTIGHGGPVIASTSSGLKLEQDKVGLKFRFRPPSNDFGRQLLADIDRGRLSGVSPGIAWFKSRQWTIGNENERCLLLREVDKLPEIALTNSPRQDGTSVSVRRTLKQRRRRLEEAKRELAGAA